MNLNLNLTRSIGATLSTSQPSAQLPITHSHATCSILVGGSDGAIFDRAAISSLIAGASAGIISDGVTYPISTAKSRLQVAKVVGTKPPSTSTVLMNIVRTEGWMKLYSGFGTVAVAAPARALYFLGYELSRRQGDKLFGPNHPATSFLSGPIAQLSGSLLWVPMDVVKERLQIQRSPLPANASAEAIAAAAASTHGNTRFTGSLNAATTILRDEGIRGWYRGYWAHQCVWGPFNAVYFTGYEFLKQQWSEMLNKGRPTRVVNDNVEIIEPIAIPSYAFPICGAFRLVTLFHRNL